MSELTGLTGLYPDLRVNGEELAWYWEQADRLGLAVTLNLGRIGSRSYQTDAVEEVATRYPRARIVIAHLAHLPLANSENERSNALWQEQILLGRHENISFDTSSLPALGVDDYPFPTALRYIRQAAELVGADKLMWGSDIPSMLCHATYQQLLNMLVLRSGLTEQQLEEILGETAQQVYLPTS
jgi:hypothetical protein